MFIFFFAECSIVAHRRLLVIDRGRIVGPIIGSRFDRSGLLLLTCSQIAALSRTRRRLTCGNSNTACDASKFLIVTCLGPRCPPNAIEPVPATTSKKRTAHQLLLRTKADEADIIIAVRWHGCSYGLRGEKSACINQF